MLTEDEHEPLYALGRPTGHRLQGREDIVEALAEVAQHVIAIHAQAVLGVERRRRAADEHRSRDQILKMALGGEELFPVR